MKIIWCRCDAAIFLLIAFCILSSFPTPTQGQRRSMRVNQNQVERVLKRFKTSKLAGVSYEEKLKEILACLENDGCNVGAQHLTNEILLRGQMREMGEDCTSNGKYGTAFDGANYNYFVPDEYRRYQEELLDTGLIFCNPLKHLYCSPKKKCACRPGTALKPEINPEVCTLISGGFCMGGHSLFDPFNSDKITALDVIAIPALQCSENTTRFFEDTCPSLLSYFKFDRQRLICFSNGEKEFGDKLFNHFLNSPRLSFGEPCNSEHHKEVLKANEEEWANYLIRVKKLGEIMDAKTQFCDLRRLLFCGNISGKCECMKPAFYDENKKNCTYKTPHDYCTHRYVLRRSSDTFSSSGGFDLSIGIETTGDRECKVCTNTNPVKGESIFSCRICPDLGFIGRDCTKNKTLTLFLSGFIQPNLPTDVIDFGEQIDLLVELSDNATELEKSFVLEKGSACDMEIDQEGARAIRRIRNLEAEGTVPVTTKAYYIETTRFIQNLIRKLKGRRLCKFPWRQLNITFGGGPFSYKISARPDLVCGPNAINSKCYEPNNTEYLEILRRRLIPFETIQDGQPCPLGLDQLFAISRQEFGEGEGYYLFLIVQLETHYVNETQFCDSKSGLECKFPGDKGFITDVGKCVSNGNSGDLRANAVHFILVSFLVILFILHGVLI